MPTAKVENYTVAQTANMVEKYLAGGRGTDAVDFDARDAIVESLATELKKGVRSVRSKLTREKTEAGEQVYIARSTVSKVTGVKPAKKDLMAQNLVESAGDTSAVSKTALNADSIEKMNKTDISIMTAQFNALFAEIADQNATIGAYQAEFGDLTEPEDENDSQEGEIDSES